MLYMILSIGKGDRVHTAENAFSERFKELQLGYGLDVRQLAFDCLFSDYIEIGEAIAKGLDEVFQSRFAPMVPMDVLTKEEFHSMMAKVLLSIILRSANQPMACFRQIQYSAAT